jgi:hypothetical protein
MEDMQDSDSKKDLYFLFFPEKNYTFVARIPSLLAGSSL